MSEYSRQFFERTVNQAYGDTPEENEKLAGQNFLSERPPSLGLDQHCRTGLACGTPRQQHSDADFWRAMLGLHIRSARCRH